MMPAKIVRELPGSLEAFDRPLAVRVAARRPAATSVGDSRRAGCLQSHDRLLGDGAR